MTRAWAWFAASRFASGVGLSLLAVPAIALVSKFIGLVREAMLTKLLGLGGSLDLFVIFTTIPIYAQAYILGPFGVAFYASLTTPGASAWALARRLAGWLLLGGFAVAGITLIFAFLLKSRIEADSLSSGIYAAIATACALSVPLALICGLAICLLHAVKRHSSAVLLSVSQPWVFVALLLLIDQAWRGGLFAPIGFAFAASFAVAAGLCLVFALRWRDRPAGEEIADTASFRRHLGYASLETTGFFANQLATMFFAGLTGAGGIAANGLAARVMLTPLTLLLTPLSPILQNIYRSAAPDRRRRLFVRAYALSLAAVSFLIMAVVYFGEDVVRLFFQRGAFDAADTARVSALLLPYGLYVICIAANQLCAAVAFISGTGKSYTLTMLANYGVGNLLKFPALTAYGLEGVIWACVATEGAAAIANGWRQFARHRAERETGR
ncbi:MAG: lipid II flippase MurJ [Alphaproteobacteria bacterium]